MNISWRTTILILALCQTPTTHAMLPLHIKTQNLQKAKTTMDAGELFSHKLRMQATKKLAEAICLGCDEAADSAIEMGALTDPLIKSAIDQNNLWALQRLIGKGLVKSPTTWISYLISMTKITDNPETRELNNEIFYLLLEQLPISQYPTLSPASQAYFECDPKAYCTLKKTTTKKEFLEWFDPGNNAKIKALVIQGTNRQLRNAAEQLAGSLGRVDALKTIFLCALANHAWCNVIRTLSLCAEQHLIDLSMLGDGEKSPDILSSGTSALKELPYVFAGCGWISEIPYIRTAFAPIKTQNNLQELRVNKTFNDLQLVFK